MSYGKSQGVPEDVLGIFRSVGAALGTIAAITYTVMERRFGVILVGFCGLSVCECHRSLTQRAV